MIGENNGKGIDEPERWWGTFLEERVSSINGHVVIVAILLGWIWTRGDTKAAGTKMGGAKGPAHFC